MDEQEKGKHRPQHLMTPMSEISAPVNLKPANKEWPKEWKENPDVLKIVAEHQQWLGHPSTQRLKSFIENEVNRNISRAAAMTEGVGYSSEQIRVVMSKVDCLLDIKKVIYDTEKFVEQCVKGR